MPPGDWHVLIPLLILVPIAVSTAAIEEIDSYWHVVVGEELLETRTATGLGDSWAWYDPPEPWTTSQWLSEAVMAGLVRWVGWDALVYATTLTTIALTLGVVWVVLRRATGPRAVLLIALAVLPLVQWIQVRPAMVSLVATVVVADLADRVLTSGRMPRWWLLPLVTLWANIHGQWVIAPAAIGLAGLLYWLEDPRRRRHVLGRTTLAVILMLAAGSLTPLGVRALTFPFMLRDATTHIDEWQRVYPLSWEFLPVALIGAVLLWNWTRRQPPRPVEVGYGGFWVLFSLFAERNTIVAALLLLPLAARSMAGPDTSAAQEASKFGLVGTAAATLVATVLTLAGVARVEALSATTPLKIAETLASDYDSVRVLNHYNSAGVLAAFGPPGIELGIDGRAERYGRDYIDRYLDTFALRGQEWQRFLDEFDPQVAVIEEDQAIRHLLVDDWGWRIARRDDPYILLVPPESGPRGTTQDGP